MDDIQSWWEVPSIAHFCSLFRVAFNLLDFDIEELEEALLTDGTELNGSSLLQDLIVRLLCGCLGHNGISTFNYQMFLRRLFRTKCKEQGRDNPFNTDIDFQFLPLRTKVEILHALCDFRLDADDVIDVLKNLDSDSLRVHPLGYDESKAAYWYFYGTRLYKEEYPKKRKRKKDHDKFKSKKKKNKTETSSEEEIDELGTTGTWKVMCYTEEDWRNLADSLAGSSSKEERALYTVLSEDFLPEIPRLFEEKERLQKKRMMENRPRRQSQRIEKLKSMKTDNVDNISNPGEKPKEDERYLEREKINREKYERRERRAARASHRSRSNSTDNSSMEDLDDMGATTLVGRQTNNSLASATGEIIIKPNRQKFRNTQLFRRTREDLMTGMYKILDRVKAHDDAWPFLDPVDEAYAPKYYAVIAKPMDLQTMEDKLDNGEYGSLQQFKADFQLIVDNCRQYNGSGNEYTEMARRLQELFEASAERYLEVELSSEDEPPVDNQSDDTLGSSLTPMNGPRSRSISSSCHSQCSERENNYINYDTNYANRTKHTVREHKSRLRKRQKRKKKTRKDDYSTADDYDSSRDTSRSKSRHSSNKRRTRSLTDSSNDRSIRSNRKHNNRKDRISVIGGGGGGGSSSDNKHDGKVKDTIKLNNRETSHDRNKNKDSYITNDLCGTERTRTRINYKEEETTDTDIFSDISDDSNYNSKYNKQKTPPKKPVKRAGVIKNSEALAALELATEETLKDISRWLDDTPKFSEFSSNSNSPLHVTYAEDIVNIEGEYRRRLQMDRPVRPRDRLSNDLHRRRMFKEQLGLKRRKEVQRTIDRLQPGKSKGNLLSKEHQDNSGVEPKFPTSDNDDNTPKISLGKVLASDVLGFGIGDSSSCKKDSEDDCTEDKLVIEEDIDLKEDKTKVKLEDDESNKDNILVKEEKPVIEVPEPKKEKPTPNLSAWFKAFGAPKAQVTVKKKVEQEEVRNVETVKASREEESIAEEEKKLPCIVDSPARRQRRTSTGSSVSERSSFSQEPNDGNSPRPSIDEPYLSPQQEPKPYHHSPINGTIKVGFYQDTCFPRGSSEKSSSPRDLPSCSPRDLPSMSPRTPYCSPRTPYCSPRHAPISPREYPNASPRTPYCSPRHRPMSPKDYPNSSPREIHSSSPQHFSVSSPQELVTNIIRREYINESQQEISVINPKENHPVKNDYQAFSPVPHGSNTPIYGGLTPHYPSHLSYLDNSKSISDHYRNVEKTPISVYPVKKRAYNEIENVQSSKSSPEPISSYKGGSFTPTRGAMEQERTFTPTPGRLPGPSQPLRVTESGLPLGLTHPLQHHLIDPYGDERHLSSPYYTSEGVFSKGQTASTSHPIFSQPSVLQSSFPRDTNISHNYDRHENDNNPQASRIISSYDSRNSPTPTTYPTSQPESYKSKPPLINYSNRTTPPRLNTASPNSQLPLNYSNISNNDVSNKESPSTSKLSESPRIEEVPTTSTSYNKVHSSDITHEKYNTSPSLAFTNSRLSDMLPPKVNTSYNRSIAELSPGINYGTSQDLSKISVPLSTYSNQSDLLSAKMNYNHPMADLMQSSARYNYQMSELMQGKGTVYNHPMQDFIQGKPSSYSNIIQPNLSNYNRPIGDIIQRKVNDIQSNDMVYPPPPPRTSLPPVNKPEPPPTKPKKGRKKKSETPTTGFQQYIAPTSEPLSLKTSGVPGSAFNFGPPLKDSYTYLEDIRSPYYVSRNENSPNKSSTSHSPSYFLGHTSSRPPTYPHALYNAAQYQEYLQCATRHPEELLRPMVIHQGLLPPAAGYPPGYLGMPNTINRPSWL